MIFHFQVVVEVTNHLSVSGFTVHWHGIHQVGTPWMDGVPYVTQCPILPRQTFTYRFIATPAGTHWWHSHFQNQRVDGFYGFLIVHKVAPIVSSFTMAIGDWFHVEGKDMTVDNPLHMTAPGVGDLLVDLDNRDFAMDGTQLTMLNYHSGLINGRGRYDGRPFPLTEYTVMGGRKMSYRYKQYIR